MSNTANVAQNYKFLGMSSLDQKNSVKTINELIDFTDFRPFNYYRGMIVFCHETGKYYCWTDELQGKITIAQDNYIYPNGAIYEDINYSGIEFNFIEFNLKGERGERGPQGLQGLQGIPGPKGDSGNSSSTNDTNETIYQSLIPFTIQELQNNNWRLSLGVNIKRLFFEQICFPEYFKGKNLPTVYSIDELLKNNIITNYNLINDNSVLLQNFTALAGVPLNEKFYYNFHYTLKSLISYTVKTPITLSMNYSESENDIGFFTITYIQNVVNSLGLLTKYLEITRIPSKGELTQFSQGLVLGQKIEYNTLSSPIGFAPNKLDLSENNGDFIDYFEYRLIDTAGNYSNTVRVELICSYIISNTPPNASLYWEEDGSQDDLSGILNSKDISYQASDNNGSVEVLILEKYNGTNWVTFNSNLFGGIVSVELTLGVNLFRLKAVDNENSIGYSNVLKYTREEVILPTALLSTNLQGNGTADLNNSDTNCFLFGLNFETFNNSTLFSAIWQKKLVSENSWIDNGPAIENEQKEFQTNSENYSFRIKLTDSNGNIGYSNEIKKLYSGLPTQSYWYQGRWLAGDTVHNPEVNCWVDYKDENNVQHRFIIGPYENGCQEIIASSIVATSGVDTCVQEQLNTFGVVFSTNTSGICSIQTSNIIVGFNTITPSAGDVIRKWDGTPYTGNYSYIKIFNYGNVTNDNRVFIATGGTGVLGSEYDCNGN